MYTYVHIYNMYISTWTRVCTFQLPLSPLLIGTTLLRNSGNAPLWIATWYAVCLFILVHMCIYICIYIHMYIYIYVVSIYIDIYAYMQWFDLTSVRTRNLPHARRVLYQFGHRARYRLVSDCRRATCMSANISVKNMRKLP